MRPKFPESLEEKAARLAARSMALASGSLEFEIARPALPSAEALAQQMIVQLEAAGAQPWEAQAVGRTTAEAGREIMLGLTRGDVSLQDLPASALVDLEAVVSVADRPSWFIRGGLPSYERVRPTDEFWISLLDAVRRQVMSASAKVGCIFREEAGQRSPIGTGWLIAPGLIVTNAHVAHLLYRRMAIVRPGDRHDGWRPDPAYTGLVVFAFENGSPAPAAVALEAPAFIETDPDQRADIAVLRFAPAGDAVPPSPIDLELDPGSAAAWQRRDVIAIGHLVKDLNDDRNVDVVFGALDGTERVSPGKLLGVLGPRVLAHDCSTTNGSSGSPIIDLRTFRAVGLHYWGRPGARNEAVLLPAVKDHPAIVRSLGDGFA